VGFKDLYLRRCSILIRLAKTAPRAAEEARTIGQTRSNCPTYTRVGYAGVHCNSFNNGNPTFPMSLCPSLRREKKIILSYLFLLESQNTCIHTHILAPINLGIQQIPTHLQKTKPAYDEINTLDNIWKLAHLKKGLKRGMELCLCRHRKCTIVSCREHQRIGCATSPVLSKVVASEMKM
jgi:hypothetical protein